MMRSTIYFAFASVLVMAAVNTADVSASSPTLDDRMDTLSGQVAEILGLLRQTPQAPCYGRRAQTSPVPETAPPTPLPTANPTILELTYTANSGNFVLYAQNNCTAKFEELQKYTYIPGSLSISGSTCTNSLELNLLKGIGNNLLVSGNAQLSTFNANQLQSIGGSLDVNDNAQLGTLGLDALNQIGSNGGKRVAIYRNQANLCSERFKSVCTNTTQVTGSQCYVNSCA